MNEKGMTAVLTTLLENAFLNVIANTPSVLSGACERLFGRGTRAKCVGSQDGIVSVEVSAKGESVTVDFHTETSTTDPKEMRIVSVAVR